MSTGCLASSCMQILSCIVLTCIGSGGKGLCCAHPASALCFSSQHFCFLRFQLLMMSCSLNTSSGKFQKSATRFSLAFVTGECYIIPSVTLLMCLVDKLNFPLGYVCVERAYTSGVWHLEGTPCGTGQLRAKLSVTVFLLDFP